MAGLTEEEARRVVNADLYEGRGEKLLHRNIDAMLHGEPVEEPRRVEPTRPLVEDAGGCA